MRKIGRWLDYWRGYLHLWGDDLDAVSRANVESFIEEYEKRDD